MRDGLTILAAATLASGPTSADDVLIENAVIDGSGAAAPHMFVSVKSDRIVERADYRIKPDGGAPQ